jgi:hypothetical protein
MPSSCACCDGLAAHALGERRPSDRATVFVPYCTDCFRHASAVRTHWLVSTLASGVLGLTTAAAIPLFWSFVPALVYGASVLVAGALPLGFLLFAGQGRLRAGHSAVGRAVWWRRTGELCCTNGRFCAELLPPGRPMPDPRGEREPCFPKWILAGWVLTAVSAPLAWWVHHPVVRVINLTDTRLTVRVDGHRMIDVEPTSAENPRAGVEIRVPSGQRDFSAEDPRGQPVAQSAVRVVAARDHLYAPASREHCFWLETSGYGRNAQDASIVPLAGQVRFWILPGRVDTWFYENPEVRFGDGRSSGGELTALRQAHCADAPDAVVQASREREVD